MLLLDAFVIADDRDSNKMSEAESLAKILTTLISLSTGIMLMRGGFLYSIRPCKREGQGPNRE